MKADSQVITRLNEYLCFETTGHVQYLFHAGLCAHGGFSVLARVQTDYSAEEVPVLKQEYQFQVPPQE